MSWAIMNWVAWGLCAAIVLYLVCDVISVELKAAKSKKEGQS